MRAGTGLVALLMAAAPAAADTLSRETAMHILADAAAHAIVCRNPQMAVDKSVALQLTLATNMVPAEIEAASENIEKIARELLEKDSAIVCRDAVERYGKNGVWLKNLLVKTD